jgi:hypothetical protein
MAGATGPNRCLRSLTRDESGALGLTRSRPGAHGNLGSENSLPGIGYPSSQESYFRGFVRRVKGKRRLPLEDESRQE